MYTENKTEAVSLANWIVRIIHKGNFDAQIIFFLKEIF